MLFPSITLLISLLIDLEKQRWTTDPKHFVRPDNSPFYVPDRSQLLDGLWHVTTNVGQVLEHGLKSREQLGYETERIHYRTADKTIERRVYRQVGLGGSYLDVAPSMISMTFNLDRANKLALGIRTAALAARGKVSVADIILVLRHIHGWPNKIEEPTREQLLRQWLAMIVYYREGGEDYAHMYDERVREVLLPLVRDPALAESFSGRWQAIVETERYYDEDPFTEEDYIRFRSQNWPERLGETKQWRGNWLDLVDDNMASNVSFCFSDLLLPEALLRKQNMNRLVLGTDTPTGEELYELMGDMDRHMSYVDGVGFLDDRIGFTARYEQMLRVDPDSVAVLQLEAKRDAEAEILPEEWELRMRPADVRVIGRVG